MSAAAVPGFDRVRRWLAGARPGPDADLLRRFVEGHDGAAFTALVDRHGPMVLAVARRVTGDHHAAEDVFQAAFLTLARRARQLRRPAGLPGWLHQTAYHLALTAVRARDRRERAEAVTPTLSGGDPFADLSARELLGVLDEELSRLPDRLRQPLVLCGLEGRSQDEAAALLGWTAGAVRGRLERGRRRLKERLARRGLTFGVAVAAMLLLNRPAAVARPLRQVALATALGPAGPPPTVTALLEAGLRSASAVRHGAFALVLAGLVGVGAATLSSREQPKPNSAPPATRPETFLLPAGAGGRLGWDPLRVGYASAVLTPDGKKLVAITAGAVLHMFDATGKPLDRRPLGDRRALHPSIGDVSLSGDGSVATFSENSSTGARLTACETATGRQLLRLGYAPAHALSADGRALAVVEYVPDKGAEMLRVYDLGTGKPRDLAPSGQGLYRLRFTPDGRRLLAFTDPNSEKLACLDTADGKQLWSVRSSGPDHAATTDGQTVFVNGPSGKGPILALDAATGRPAEGFKLPTLRAAAAPAPAGDRLLLVPLWSGEVVVWDYRDGEEVRRLPANRPGPDSFTQAFAPASDGRTAVTNGDGLRGWDLATGKQLFGPAGGPGHTGAVRALAFLPGGGEVVSVGSGSELVQWHLAGGRTVSGLPRPAGPEVWVTRAGVRTAVVDWSRLTVGDAAGKPVGAVTFLDDRAPRGPEMFWRYALLADGRTAVTYFPRKDKALVAVTDYLGSKTLSQAEVPPPDPFAYFQAFSPCGRWLVTNGRLFAVGSGRQLYTPSAGGGLGLSRRASVAFSPDGRLFAGALKHEKEVVERDEYGVWEAASGGLVATLSARHVGQVALGPDNRTLAHLTGWGIHLTDLTTGKGVAEYEAPGVNCTTYMTSEARTLVFAPDGRSLATGHHDGSLTLWKVPEPAAEKSGHAELEAAWDELAGADAAKARPAVDGLARTPGGAAFVGEKFKAPTAPADVDVPALIGALDSPRFAAREQATARLREVGLKAEPALREALKTATPEMRRRIEQLLEGLDPTPRLPLRATGVRGVRAVEILERSASPEARASLRAWAEQPVDPMLAAEARLALDRLRFQEEK